MVDQGQQKKRVVAVHFGETFVDQIVEGMLGRIAFEPCSLAEANNPNLDLQSPCSLVHYQ